MSNIGLGSEKLIRNLSIENRKLYHQQTLNKYRIQSNQSGKKLTGNERLLVVEWIEGGYWTNTCLVTRDNVEIGRLIQSKKFKKNDQESINFCTAKGQKLLTPMLKISQIWEKYRDHDDNIIYLRLIRQNSF